MQIIEFKHSNMFIKLNSRGARDSKIEKKVAGK